MCGLALLAAGERKPVDQHTHFVVLWELIAYQWASGQKALFRSLRETTAPVRLLALDAVMLRASMGAGEIFSTLGAPGR